MNGVEASFGDRLDIIRLDLLSAVGREASREFGVRLVPATLLFDDRSLLLLRHIGLPDATRIGELLARQ